MPDVALERVGRLFKHQKTTLHCAQCTRRFSRRTADEAKRQRRKGAGPFCSLRCSCIHHNNVRFGRLPVAA